MNFGTSYYPEITPEAEWATDLANMAEAGLTVVRIAEFAWSAMEPREGVFTWEWLDRFLDLATENGLKVILCTPTATPPAWLTRQYPEVSLELADGTRRGHGGRRDMDLDNEVYRHFCADITGRLGQRYGQHPAVLGWQLDNELFGVEGPGLPPGCHSPAATFRFRQYLKEVHGDLATLNARWGTRFWSQEYSDWGEIETPRHPRATAGHWMDFARWFNHSLASFLRLQAEVLRSHISPAQFITHNSTAIFDRGTDHFQLAESLDLVGWDAYYGAAGNPYPEAFTALAHDLFRSIKGRPFLVLETNPIPPSLPSPAAFFAEMRAHGASMAILWHWREHPAGCERRSDTVCDYAGRPCPQRMAFLKAITARPELKEPLPARCGPRKVAMMLSTDAVSAFLAPHPWGQPPQPLPCLRVAIEAYVALRRLGLPVDVVRPGDFLSAYRLVVAPALKQLDLPAAEGMAQFVANGGTLLTLGKTAHETPWISYYRTPGQPLAEVLGFTVPRDLNPPGPLQVQLTAASHRHLPSSPERAVSTPSDAGPGALGSGLGSATQDLLWASEPYADQLSLTTATALAHFSGGPWSGLPAATVHAHGRGHAYHAGALCLDLIRYLTEEAAQSAGLTMLQSPDEDLVLLPALEAAWPTPPPSGPRLAEVETGDLPPPAAIWAFNYGSRPLTYHGVTIPPGDFRCLTAP